MIYSLTHDDQPALTRELVEWAESNDFEMVSAGEGSRFVPNYHISTLDTVCEYASRSLEVLERENLSAHLCNPVLDGTKWVEEMAAVGSAPGLVPQAEGPRPPPCGIDKLASACRRHRDGGHPAHKGTHGGGAQPP